MFNKLKKTVVKVLSKEKKTVSTSHKNRRRYSSSSTRNKHNKNQRKNYNSNNQNKVQRTMKSSPKINSNVKESGEVNKSMQFRSLASYRKRRGKLDPALPEDVAFRSPEDGGDISLKIHHSHSSYSQKDKARIIFQDKSIFVKDSEKN